MNARKRCRLRPKAKTLPQAMREFLTPAVFKQARKSGRARKRPRWDVHPLIYVALLMTWCTGDSLPEKFEVARAYCVVMCPKRRRPGKTFSGFEKALSQLPMPVLRGLASALRGRIQEVLGRRLLYQGFIPLGCDGTRHQTPRTEELERRLGTTGEKDSSSGAPMVWNTSIVHLTTGIPWCWRFGRGSKASERLHLMQMIALLPQLALVVTDAGYMGYELMRAMVEAHVSFLIRMSSKGTFYTELEQPLEHWREGIAYYWPETIRKAGLPPLRGRLICIQGKKRKVSVWLFTNVVDRQRLSVQLASQLYRWRWESEGFFRTYKRTLQKVKFSSRTLRVLHREAEASMIATQLLFCQGALAMPEAPPAEAPVMCSPRKVLLEIRVELRCAQPNRNYGQRLTAATRERRPRCVGKEKRPWPGRKEHKPPNPPKVLKMSDALKSKINNYLLAA